jgi:hypothetical protein
MLINKFEENSHRNDELGKLCSKNVSRPSLCLSITVSSNVDSDIKQSNAHLDSMPLKDSFIEPSLSVLESKDQDYQSVSKTFKPMIL